MSRRNSISCPCSWEMISAAAESVSAALITSTVRAVVSSAGASGAVSKDIGVALLLQLSNGLLHVLGVVSGGHQQCVVGVDHYDVLHSDQCHHTLGVGDHDAGRVLGVDAGLFAQHDHVLLLGCRIEPGDGGKVTHVVPGEVSG